MYSIQIFCVFYLIIRHKENKMPVIHEIRIRFQALSYRDLNGSFLYLLELNVVVFQMLLIHDHTYFRYNYNAHP